MLKRKSKFLVLVICLLLIAGCTSKNNDALDFKKEFDSYNDTLTSVNISKDNRFKISNEEEILGFISENQSFVVFFGNAKDLNSRAIVEKIDENARLLGLPKVYYIDVDAIRDNYEMDENGIVTKTKDSTRGYDELVNFLSDYLSDYTVIKNDEEVSVGVKKIDMPLVVGVIKSKVSSIARTEEELYDVINEVVIDLSTCDINTGC